VARRRRRRIEPWGPKPDPGTTAGEKVRVNVGGGFGFGECEAKGRRGADGRGRGRAGRDWKGAATVAESSREAGSGFIVFDGTTGGFERARTRWE